MTYSDILGTNKKPTIKEKMYTFQEPHPTGGDCVVTISTSQIVAYMTKIGAKTKIQKKHPNLNVSDEILIQDFCTVHWASEVT